MNFMKKIWIAVLMALNISRMYGMEFQENKTGIVSIAKSIGISALGATTLLYGIWHGVVYGIQYALPSNDDSHKATKNDLLKNVIAPISTGVTIFLAQARCPQKN